MRLIGLSGYAQSGKDTVGSILVENHGFTRVSFADKLRECLYALNPLVGCSTGYLKPDETAPVQHFVDKFGWEWTKANTGSRELLQRLGTEVGRNILGENVWVDAALKGLDWNGSYVVTDVRFPNEYDAITARLGAVWRIERPGTEPVNAHPSETALDDRVFDLYLHNEGSIEDLEVMVDSIITTGGVQ